MKVPWPANRCVLCCCEGQSTEEGRLTEEHLIPESVGGKLTSPILCKNCNSTLGGWEARLKFDPAIHLAVGNLQRELPDLYLRMCEGLTFNTQGEGGIAKGKYKDGRFRINETKRPDGSLIYEPGNARKHLERMLKSSGYTENVISDSLHRLDEIPENCQVPLVPGFEVANWSISRIDPELDARQLIVDLRNGKETLQGAGVSLLKAAYEFLALIEGKMIFGEAYEPIRVALRENNPAYGGIQGEWVRSPARRPKPYHGLLVEKAASHRVVQVMLFGDLRYRVKFPFLVASDHLAHMKYMLDLMTGEELLEH